MAGVNISLPVFFRKFQVEPFTIPLSPPSKTQTNNSTQNTAQPLGASMSQSPLGVLSYSKRFSSPRGCGHICPAFRTLDPPQFFPTNKFPKIPANVLSGCLLICEHQNEEYIFNFLVWQTFDKPTRYRLDADIQREIQKCKKKKHLKLS